MTAKMEKGSETYSQVKQRNFYNQMKAEMQIGKFRGANLLTVDKQICNLPEDKRCVHTEII